MTNKRLSFLISAAYVTLATFHAYYSMENMSSEGVLFYFFLPANFFAQLIIYTERNPFLFLLISQLISFGITYFIISIVLRAFRKDKL